MRTLQTITKTLSNSRGTALRTITTRTGGTAHIDTPRACQNASSHGTYQPATSANTPLDLFSNQGMYCTNWSSRFDSPPANGPYAQGLTRSVYSTQIYHGQACPPTRRGLHMEHVTNPGLGPATGLGTGVNISAQMFGFEIRPNATESEAYVVADRSEVDPLPPELHHTIRLGAGEAAPRPTESEEDVLADRGSWEDPLMAKRVC
ncbi:hypothetical protein N658DRAFT_527388 [Parathielavia hyrcaniae]|uniref:Uncharacterized protein n=1 Tax=Parathielavia hyrcaniae TaxID=113614 RepID=A0AAN6PVU2_9PEZI|nr:hypothetical protein N658DRAFT_527388 [Parathielavia hyrcaniae]